MARAGDAIDDMAERVHVGTQRQHRTRYAAVDLRHDAGGLIDIARHFQPGFLKLIGNIGGRFKLLKAQFWNLMQIVIVL